MEMALRSIPNLSLHEPVRDDDQVDQLHNYVTVYLMLTFAAFAGFKEFAAQPLDCWLAEMGLGRFNHYQIHANRYCWRVGVYAFPNTSNMDQMPYELSRGDNSELDPQSGFLNTYKWITLVFILQAVLFKLPNILWAECNINSGTRIAKIVGILKDTALKNHNDRKAELKVVANFLETWLRLNGRRDDLHRDPEGEMAWGFEMNCKNKYLSTMYVVVKLCYLVNLLFQFLFLNYFLGFDFWRFGLKWVSDGIEHFPIRALCHFEVKGHSEWVQCILVMNMFLDKIFILEWLWLLILLIVTVLYIMIWVPKVFRHENGLGFLSRYMRVTCKNEDYGHGRGSVRHFVCHYLGQDGIFLLRVISMNTGTVVMAELMACLLERYRADQVQGQGQGQDGSRRQSQFEPSHTPTTSPELGNKIGQVSVLHD